MVAATAMTDCAVLRIDKSHEGKQNGSADRGCYELHTFLD
jgi:hypothetical protein